MSQDDTIHVAVRSHVVPTARIKEFEFGKPFQVSLASGATLETLLQQLFVKNIKEIGFTAVNGKIAKKDTNLMDGDLVFVFSLISGG